MLKIVFRPWAEGARNVPRRGPAIMAEQSPLVRRPLFRPAPAAAASDLPGQVGVLYRPRDQGPDQQGLLQRPRPDTHRPGRRRGQRARDPDRPARARRRQAARHLPGGHPQSGRPALPRQDRRRPAGPGGAGPGDPVRDGGHVRVHAVGPDPAELQGPARRTVRRAAGLLPVLRDGVGPPRAAGGHRRGDARHREALRPGIRGHLRPAGQGETGGGCPAAGHGRAAAGNRGRAPGTAARNAPGTAARNARKPGFKAQPADPARAKVAP
jgi:hypothetical protein